MNENTNKVLLEWYQRVVVTQKAHYYSADHFRRRNFMLGIPAVILSTFVGTTVFATLQKKPELAMQIAVGLASVTAALLTSLQTFLGYSERAEKHRIAGAKYGALGRELEYLKTLIDIDPETVNNLRSKLDTLAIESPNNPIKIYRKAGSKALEPKTTPNK